MNHSRISGISAAVSTKNLQPRPWHAQVPICLSIQILARLNLISPTQLRKHVLVNILLSEIVWNCYFRSSSTLVRSALLVAPTAAAWVSTASTASCSFMPCLATSHAASTLPVRPPPPQQCTTTCVQCEWQCDAEQSSRERWEFTVELLFVAAFSEAGILCREQE